jgi:hypothetical protein
MHSNNSNELSEKLKELNAFFANMIAKMNEDIRGLERGLQNSRALLSTVKAASLAPVVWPKPLIGPEVLNGWQQPLN